MMISEFAHCYFFLRVFKFFKTLKNVFCLSGNVMEAPSFLMCPQLRSQKTSELLTL